MTEEQGHFRQRKGSVKEDGFHGELKIAVQGKSMCFMRFIGDPLVKRGDPKGPPTQVCQALPHTFSLNSHRSEKVRLG